MPKIDMEYFYMLGIPINLEDRNLGIIYQPTLRDFINNGVDIVSFTHPFLLDKDMVLNRNQGVDEYLNNLGRLQFLIVYDECTKEKRLETGERGILEYLVDSLKLIYKTNDIQIIPTISSIIVDKKFIITNDNFGYLSKLIIEMTRVNVKEMKKKIEEERKKKLEDKEEDPYLKRFRELERQYNKEKEGEKKDFSLLDMINIVIHSQSVIDYDKVFDLTVYQLKNSYEVIINKETYNVNLMHRISPNFQPSEDFKLWEEKANVIRSELNK